MNLALTIPLADTWGMHGDDVGTGWMVVMMVVMVLFWAAVIFGIFWLIRGSTRGWSPPAASSAARESALEALERRFAEGEISVEDYRTRRDVLEDRTVAGNGARDDPPITNLSPTERSAS